MKTLNKFCALLLCLLLLFGLTAPAAAAAAKDSSIIRIYTANDLIRLASQCSLDSWSQGKTVLLERNIDLSLTQFCSIATFGGTFDGQGNTISGVNLRPNGEVQGLFRYIQTTGVVKNLTVDGTVLPSDHKSVIGGIVGINRGTVTKCMFRGTVRGENSVGGIAGINESSGQIINCTFIGSLIGEHYAGGITGQNLGSLVQCRNNGEINTAEVKAKLDLENLNLEQLNSTANMPACTDVGGIAGFSPGTIQSCTNNGNVGYPHVGYNVGGIVGRHNGYLDNCVNKALVQGRKDVGGIAGQMEPQLMLKYDQSALDQIWGELDTLETMINGFLERTSGAADALTGEIQNVSDSAAGVKDAVTDLTDAMTQWADGGISQINDASARISWVLERMVPVTDTLEQALGLIEQSVDLVAAGLDDASLAADYGAEAATAIEAAMDSITSALGMTELSMDKLRSAMDHISEGLGDSAVYTQAIHDLAAAISDFTAAFSGIAAGLDQLYTAMDNVYEWVQTDPDWINLRQSTGQLRDAFTRISATLGEIAATLDKMANDPTLQTGLNLLSSSADLLLNGFTGLGLALDGFLTAYEQFRGGSMDDALNSLDLAFADLNSAWEDLVFSVEDLSRGLELIGDSRAVSKHIPALLDQITLIASNLDAANQAIAAINSALDLLAESDVPEAELAAARAALDAIVEQIGSAAAAAEAFSAVLTTLSETVDPAELETAWEDLKLSVSTLKSAVYYLGIASEHMADAMALLSSAADALSSGLDRFSNAGTILSDAFGALEQAAADVESILDELAAKPTIEFEQLEGTVTDEGEALNAAADSFIDSFNQLNSALRAQANLLTDDLQAINGQLGVIADLLHRFQQEQADKNAEDLLEDVSRQASDDTMTSGKLSACENLGSVEGDVNVAGIVGSVAIEYDFDPEDDLIVNGSRSIDFACLTRAVIRSCINRGQVTAKKNSVGGIVGLVDLGYITGCQAYGAVTSTAGKYVGGIAGQSYGAIAACWAKCSLSGGSYVGGIAGFGSVIENCRTLIDAQPGTPFIGTVAGQADELSLLSGNLFVHHLLAGVDGISYQGAAEPVSYEQLVELEGLPADFTEFALTFIANGKTVEVIPFRYGDGLDSLPEIPAKSAHSAQWPQMDYSFLCFSHTLEAQYTPYDTALSDGLSLPDYLVDGSFSPEAQTSVTRSEVDWVNRKGEVCQVPVYTVSVTDPQAEQVSCTLHWRLPGDGEYDLWILQGSQWVREDYTPDGSYLLLACPGGELTFCLTARESTPLWVFATAAAALVILVIAAVSVTKAIKKRKKEKVLPKT